MFNLPDRYKTDVKVALKDFIPKDLKPNDKKRIKDAVKEVRLVYQIAGEEIPSVVDANYRCQAIQFFDIEVVDIKDAQFLASTYQNIIKPYCVIHMHDAKDEVYSFAVKRLNQQDDTQIVIEESLVTEKYPMNLPDEGRNRLLAYMDFLTIKNKLDKDFVYNDNFKMTEEEGLISDGAMDSQGERFIVNSSSQNRFHANWMNMMYPRLQIAKDLLKESGLIFISISDIEISNLRILCDEIFGASNFVVDLIWANKEGGGSSDSKLFRIKHEHILCYAKNIAEVEVIGIPVGNEDRYKSEDEYVKERGKYYLQKLGMGSIQYSQSLDYPIEVPDGTTVMPADNNGGKKACWRWSKQKYEWGKANGFIEIKKDGSGQWTVYTKQ
ncbi:MAG TPA: hypothetical protein DCQ87_01075 [Lachnospiraceae bacterium]|nr:DUF4391 domain-containing protein [Lachnospiraceae bacterium]MDY4164545.1 DUF4391 domain-containing protein [Lachnospiraceae bacterium]HAP02633.1 hypothetical protein [Lachnospiraceae bacterium]